MEIMLSHAISAYSEGSATAAISAAIGQASSDYGKDAKSVHIIVVNVFKIGDGWQAIVKVIVEPDLEKNLDKELKHEEYHETKQQKKEQEEDLDMYLDVDMEVPMDNFLEMAALSHSSSIKTSDYLDTNRILIPTELEADLDLTEGILLHGITQEQHPDRKESIQNHSEVGGFYDLSDKSPSPEVSQETKKEEKLKITLDKLKTKHTPELELESEPSIYIYISSTHTEIYDRLSLTELHAHIHLIEEGSQWDNIQNFFLDIKFYEAVHYRELKLRQESDSRALRELNQKPERKLKQKALLEELTDDF